MERLLREAELALALAPPAPVSAPPRPEAEAVDWRPLLFQQFHDILPGTSIPEVYVDSDADYEKIFSTPRALSAHIASQRTQ